MVDLPPKPLQAVSRKNTIIAIEGRPARLGREIGQHNIARLVNRHFDNAPVCGSQIKLTAGHSRC